MILFIIIFGMLTCLTGIVILVNPEIVFYFLRKNSDRLELHVVAIAIRLVLGAFLIFQSGASKYPYAIEIVGWLSIIAAVFFALMGRENFKKLMTWALSQAKTLGRAGGVFASLFGAFLIHAFI